MLQTHKDNPSIIILADDMPHLSITQQEPLILGLSLNRLQASYSTSINDNYFRLHDKTLSLSAIINQLSYLLVANAPSFRNFY
ncbi:hypothetical protein [Alcaligenes aquatilis]|uniref:hypothetical protein n=1 Tax=Alcaligenes aquatilis TaxID=323284 RepID=UPI000D52E993|nr:hypothetical protein [Alcaligenes aquatilis]AWG36404.1 hypothetical protein CA948_15395 [Alcaligenes aquatilis]